MRGAEGREAYPFPPLCRGGIESSLSWAWPFGNATGVTSYDFDTAAAALMPQMTAAPRGQARGSAMERKRIRLGLVKKRLWGERGERWIR
jgi:hypothetical protein